MIKLCKKCDSSYKEWKLDLLLGLNKKSQPRPLFCIRCEKLYWTNKSIAKKIKKSSSER